MPTVNPTPAICKIVLSTENKSKIYKIYDAHKAAWSKVATMMIYSEQNSQLNTFKPLLNATPDECTHLGPHCIEIVELQNP